MVLLQVHVRVPVMLERCKWSHHWARCGKNFECLMTQGLGGVVMMNRIGLLRVCLLSGRSIGTLILGRATGTTTGLLSSFMNLRTSAVVLIATCFHRQQMFF